MSLLAPTVEAFFTQRLAGQLRASPATIAAYRDTLRLLLAFARERTGKNPERLDLADLGPDLITAFLAHLSSSGATPPGPVTPGSRHPLTVPLLPGCAIPSTPR
jgi:hypothetical protein